MPEPTLGPAQQVEGNSGTVEKPGELEDINVVYGIVVQAAIGANLLTTLSAMKEEQEEREGTKNH